MRLFTKRTGSHRGLGIAAAIALAGMLVAPARADEVVSKGTTLHGKVTGLTSKEVAFESEYGAGVITMKWEDVESVNTDGSVQVLHGEDEEVIAPIRGRRDGVLIVGETEVDITTIHSAVAVGPDGANWRDRLRSQWRYWDGNFDFGFNLQQSTTDTTGLLVGLGTTRIKGPTRLLIDAGYRYSTEQKEGQPKSTIQDEFKGRIRGEYDFTERIYGYASVDAQYDSIQSLSIRTVPQLGVGYTIYLEQLDAKRQNFLKAEVGGGYVYQRYFGGEENQYFTAAFGALARYYLPYDSRFDWRFDYLPALDDFANNYLLRTTGSLIVPMFDPVSAKFSLIDEYNNQPAPNSSHNSLYIAVGLSIAW